MAGQWPKAQVDAERKRIERSLVNGDSVTPGIVTLDRATAATIKDALSFAFETLADVISQAERNGQATATLQAYRADIASARKAIAAQLR